MSYINTTLAPHEVVQYTASLSIWYIFPFCLYGLFFLGFALFLAGDARLGTIAMGFAAVGVISLIWAVVVFWSTEIAITNMRVLHKIGLISRKTTEIPLNRIASVEVNQSILGRIFGFGDVSVSGTDGNNALMKGITDPLKFRSAIMAANEL